MFIYRNSLIWNRIFLKYKIFNLIVSYGKETGGGWKFHYEYLIVQCFLLAVGLANTWRLPSLARAHGDGKTI